MENRRQRVLGTAEPVEQLCNAVEAEAVAGRGKIGQAVELGLDSGVRRPCEIGHQAAAFSGTR
jgi:hypothetical protein